MKEHSATILLEQFLIIRIHEEHKTTPDVVVRPTKHPIAPIFCQIDSLANETSQYIEVKSCILDTNRVKVEKNAK